jgi:transglutaminase-like putative cysteine protease
MSVVVLLAWAGVMAVLVGRSYGGASSNLATDLSRYGSTAQWRGVYYRGEKLGFTVSQTVPTDTGFELREDGQLLMTLLGAHTEATLHTTAQVDEAFVLQSFEFSLDPGTGPIEVRGVVRPAAPGWALALEVTSAASTRPQTLELTEPPVLAVSLPRRLANDGLVPGARHQWNVFDPATLRNAPMALTVGEREIVRDGNGSIPAFRVDIDFAGLQTSSWITDTGEVIREESPLGLLTIRESSERARAMAVPGSVRADLLEAAAVVPETKERIDEPRDVRRLRVRLEGADLSGSELEGVGQTIDGDVVEIVDFDRLTPGPNDADLARYLEPEPLIESDAPEIRAETELALSGSSGDRARAEELVRYVSALLEKKPTVSLPSAREVLRTKIGDCNEHTALYVAMARAAGIPARISVGLVFVRGAFYYHAWPEVYLREGPQRGFWLPVDPTFNQFPADSTHLRLARGGLDQQAAILPMIGRLKMTVLDLDLAPGVTRVLVGDEAPTASQPVLALPRREEATAGCWWSRLCADRR